MALLVGSARIDENGNTSGGSVGDQTGREVSTEAYYVHSKGWYVLRPKSISVANTIAKAMNNACNNNNIGYDQSNRLGIITQLKKYGSMKDIKTKTEADCSSLVRACCIKAGFDPGDFNTSNEASALEATGKFKDKKPVTSDTVLYNGDVLVTKTKGHTVIVVSGRERTDSNDYKVKVTAKSGLYCRKGVGTKHEAVTIFKYGTVLTITDTKDNWGKCSKGWVSLKYTKKI